ncbi:MAG TPA: patatin-like phospholipase family protein [Reyranella sp.]|nr:patatin-like phospholipase family protein [Reyranella sp.]
MSPPPRRAFLQWTAASALAPALSACAGPPRGTPVPTGMAGRASVLGLANERFHPLLGTDALEAELKQATERRVARRGARSFGELDLAFLAVSGGGEDGAFGAGLLCGWTEHGGRPVFDIVTGVSTGALTAPFAFLGPRYDPKLRHVYTELTAADVLHQRSLLAALNDDAMADNAPLFATISRMADEAMLRDIALAYGEGRLLLIGTTDLDAQQPVIWNIGAIAASGHPRAADLVRRVFLASAAIPGAFPPTLIDSTLDGQPHQEMHVDGGAFVQAFLYPAGLGAIRRERIAARRPVADAEAYVIRNGRFDPDWADVRRQTLSIAGRAISTMITVSGYNDMLRIYYATRRDSIGYNLAYIGREFDKVLPSPFDQGYMRALFQYGYDLGRQGYRWHKAPPYV